MADLEAYLRCLADRRRRYLLYHLREQDVTTVEALCATLADSNAESTSGRGRDPGAAAVELRHDHIPKLEALSVVDYDPRSGVVRVLEVPAELETLLEVTCRLDEGE